MINASIFSMLIIMTLFGVIYLLPLDHEKYLFALVDKHRIIEKTPQPRIIFAGDSSLAYGLDSGMIKKATGYNIVNMGLHGGLGLIYSMDEIRPYIRKNDIIIFAPDYTHYAGNGIGDNTLVEVTIVLPKMICYYSTENYKPFISNIPLTFQRRLRGLLNPTKEDFAHRRSNFNEYGDNTGHLNLPPPLFKGVESVAKYIPGMAGGQDIKRILPERLNDELARHMNDFAAYCAGRGAAVYLTFSPIMEWARARKEQEKSLRIIEGDLRKRIHMKVFGEAVDYIYPREYFFDNEFHLNKKGRDIRTKRLIDTMKRDPLLSSAALR